MKFNLKNRPKAVVGVLGHVYDGDEIVDWFEGFEAELREIGAINTVDQPYKGCPTVETLIKEILGE